ncbi:hypothetical protein B0T10DRAFT_190559 [Thelonectria olida]|uniref:Uncharacterized protein n=1 Tax=Thelonectria olida TaxID=1576542 RepID=A0A9P8VTP7_9HYPO|nr:hypothetical protein B0T10DRAFT_190559 [Thelonectria olida]
MTFSWGRVFLACVWLDIGSCSDLSVPFRMKALLLDSLVLATQREARRSCDPITTFICWLFVLVSILLVLYLLPIQFFRFPFLFTFVFFLFKQQRHLVFAHLLQAASTCLALSFPAFGPHQHNQQQ